MSLDYPIFNDDPIFGNKLKKTSCPAKSDICGNLPGVSVLPNYIIPKCNDVDFKFTLNPDESPSGCCVVETTNDTCKKYIPKSSNVSKENYDMGIQFLDETGENPRKICHSAPIRKRVIKLPEFFFSLLISCVSIIVLGVIGCCYEFWLAYGTEFNGACNLKYENKCTNKSISLIDYGFPNSLNDYPYTCSDKDKIPYPYAFFDYSKKILETDTKKDLDKLKKPLETDIKKTDIKKEVDKSKKTPTDYEFGTRFFNVFKAPVRAFGLNFLYTLFFSNLFINYILKGASKVYNNCIPLLKNVIFLLLSGILFIVAANSTGIEQLNSGPLLILSFFIMIISIAMGIVMFLTNFFLYWSPKFYNEHIKIKTENPMDERYSLFYNVFYENSTLINIILNVLLFILALISWSIAVSTGFVGSLVGLLWKILSVIYNMFAIPLWNISCFLKLFSSHAKLFAILVCISAAISSNNFLNSHITGLMWVSIALILCYELFRMKTVK
jgi:hypothetical protein